MSTSRKIGLGVLALLAVGGYVLWQRYWYYLPGLMQAISDPVEANHPVKWVEAPAAPAGEGPKPPNVVLIVADDLGYNDITLNGGGVSNGAVSTPNIDSIAKEGVNFASEQSRRRRHNSSKNLAITRGRSLGVSVRDPRAPAPR